MISVIYDNVTVIEISEYEESLLERLGLFNQDIVVCSANDDGLNKMIAKLAKSHGVNRVICRLENSGDDEELKQMVLKYLVILLVIKFS